MLLTDDGSVFQLDRDYIVGREPSLDGSVASGKSRPLRIADDSGIVSRVHAKVQLDGWRVTITDLGSANGTRVKLPKQPDRHGAPAAHPAGARHRQPGGPRRTRVPIRVASWPVRWPSPDGDWQRGEVFALVTRQAAGPAPGYPAVLAGA